MRIETQIKENKKARASEKNLRAGGERETEMRLEVMRSSFVTRVKGRETYATSLVVQWLAFHTVTAVAQVQSLLRELKSSQPSTPLPPKKEGWAERPRVQPRKQVLLQKPNKDRKRVYSWTCSEEEGGSHNSFLQWVKHGCIQLTCLSLATVL